MIAMENTIIPRSNPLGRRPAGPVWLISGAFVIVDTALTIGAMKTEGGVQWLLAIFAVIFAIGVFTFFGLVLWNRPQVLYTPADYGNAEYARAFAEAMSTPQSMSFAIEATKAAAIVSSPEGPSDVSEQDRQEKVIKEAAVASDDEEEPDRFVPMLQAFWKHDASSVERLYEDWNKGAKDDDARLV